MTMTTPSTPLPAPRLWDQVAAFPLKAQSWLDGHGRKAWIGASLLSLFVFWPVAIALVVYTGITGRWDKVFYRKAAPAASGPTLGGAFRVYGSSGNAAFDAYKAEMLKRLEDEQAAFEAFLARLRAAKDQQEFDAFMADRARIASSASPVPGSVAPAERTAALDAAPMESKAPGGFPAI